MELKLENWQIKLILEEIQEIPETIGNGRHYGTKETDDEYRRDWEKTIQNLRDALK